MYVNLEKNVKNGRNLVKYTNRIVHKELWYRCVLNVLNTCLHLNFRKSTSKSGNDMSVHKTVFLFTFMHSTIYKL